MITVSIVHTNFQINNMISIPIILIIDQLIIQTALKPMCHWAMWVENNEQEQV